MREILRTIKDYLLKAMFSIMWPQEVVLGVTTKTFINFDENQNVLSFDYWKHLLQKTC